MYKLLLFDYENKKKSKRVYNLVMGFIISNY